jgi:hypothetical protein
MAKSPEYTFLQRKNIISQQVYEKILTSHQCETALYNLFGSVPCSSVFVLKNLWSIANSSLNVWQNLTMKPSGLGFFFVGRFLITTPIFLSVIHSFKLSVYSWFNLGRLYFSVSYPFPLGYPIYWHIIARSIYLWLS